MMVKKTFFVLSENSFMLEVGDCSPSLNIINPLVILKWFRR